MEESITHKLLHAAAFLLAVAAIVAFGWDEPLRYRFMKQDEIVREEIALRPPPPVARAKASTEDWQPGGTALDRGPYRTNNGGVIYTRGFDSRQMGPRTETDSRDKARTNR